MPFKFYLLICFEQTSLCKLCKIYLLHTVNKYLLSALYVSGSIQGTVDTPVNKMDTHPSPIVDDDLLRKTNSSINSKKEMFYGICRIPSRHILNTFHLEEFLSQPRL